jgi:hypothetical protein
MREGYLVDLVEGRYVRVMRRWNSDDAVLMKSLLKGFINTGFDFGT